MPEFEYTEEAVSVTAQDHPDLKLGVMYTWTITAAVEKIAGTTDLIQCSLAEEETGATCKMVLFFTPNTHRQVSMFAKAIKLKGLAEGKKIIITPDTIIGGALMAKMKEGRSFETKTGETVTPWEIDTFSCAAVGSPRAVAKVASKPNPAPVVATTKEEGEW